MSALWPLFAGWLHAGQFFHSSRTQTATGSSKVLIFSALPHEENELLFFFKCIQNIMEKILGSKSNSTVVTLGEESDYIKWNNT